MLLVDFDDAKEVNIKRLGDEIMNVKKSDKFKFLIFIAIIFTAVIFTILNWENIKGLTIESIVDFVKTRGTYAIIIYLLIFIVKPFVVFIPSNIIVICGGIIFGPFRGILLSIIGFWFSSIIAFYTARFLGRDFVQSIVGNKFITLDDKLKGNEFKVIFFLRIIPILPYDPLSYACGFTNVKYLDFTLASILGILPEVFCYNIMGENVSNPLSIKFIVPLAVVVVITLFSKKFLNIKKNFNKDH